MTIRRVILWLTAAIGAFVGVWAAGFPQSFYDSFPGFGFVWISVDGPFNEHLIRDVGSLYLALAAASAAATFSGRPMPDASSASPGRFSASPISLTMPPTSRTWPPPMSSATSSASERVCSWGSC